MTRKVVSQVEDKIDFNQVLEGASSYQSRMRNLKRRAAMTPVYHENSKRIKLYKEVIEELWYSNVQLATKESGLVSSTI